ncbi:hypothetical protein [Clostridium taeniosporum]|uniref:Uncharacterized protein n=1 Tax=Clostridium taeniosporum TaxID=394958 RepID=A0A2I6SDG4_9CLOT|nr:hypothetical protein [Clostridium taeniosporum]AUO15615.1 hypothetical protein BGI42_15885 [Clostridium taeniosporum]
MKPNEVEAEKLSDVEKTIENVTNEGNNIAEEVSKAPKVADEVETSKINNGEVSKGARDPKTLKFSEMPEEEITKVVNKYREKSPIEIPETAKIKAQSKDGYEQISYKWNDGTYKYESRWHTRTPGAPEEQGNTWVIQRTKPGNGGTRPTTEFKIGEDEWIPGYKWYDAIGARKAGTATPEQISILDRGHWKE